MKSLTTLPVELVQLITKYTSVDDLLNLRLACKQLNYKTRDTHLNALYARRTYFLSLKSLQILLKLSQHSDLNFRVKHLQLDIACAIFNFADSINLDEDEDPDSIDQLAESLLGSRGSFLSDTRYYVSDVPLDGRYTRLLTSAFAGLPNLKTVELINGHNPNSEVSFRTFELYNPPANSSSGSSGVDLQEYERVRSTGWVDVYTLNAHQVIPAIFAASVKSHTVELENILLDEKTLKGRVFNSTGDSLAVWIPEILAIHEDHQSPFPKLKRLELPLGTLKDNEGIEQRRIFEYILRFTDTLESLKIVQGASPLHDLTQLFPASIDPPVDTLTTWLPDSFDGTHAIFPRLTSFHLESFLTSFETLNTLLVSLKGSLRTLSLVSCTIENPPSGWRRILETIDKSMGITSFKLIPAQADRKPPGNPYVIPTIEFDGAWTADSKFAVYDACEPEAGSWELKIIRMLRELPSSYSLDLDVLLAAGLE
ncbi:hypothetical protein H072_11254 [Dactylellina haptotyla CBS 200.50]|uniref:F-box domain-containing protein n=1 Tax=Dactylellina haptotyla (strain CBS 200.50) TaxID=1284197 RepID=S8B8P8_DACHA|nr:hypothetical protein H072_11254 [Dactylellina haptotyla CBS 200.50]